jgi:hypothetical protein
MKKYVSILLLLFFINQTYGQGGQTAVEFLSLQQSPLLNGAGQIGAAIPMKDASGFYYNPAQLGYFSQENNISVFFMPQNTMFMPNNFPDVSFQSFSLAAGYNFKKNDNDLPLSIGVGYFHNMIDYGEWMFTTSNNPVQIVKYSPYNSFDCFSLGACYDYYFLFNLGISIKPYNSFLGVEETETGILTEKASGTAFDFGAMITAPVSKLLFNNCKFNLDTKSVLKPKVDFTLGYSLTNVGNKVIYFDPAQADAIPRTARLGYTFNFALELSNNWVRKLNVVDYSFTAEAEDLLIKHDTSGNTQYQNLLGDINIGKNLIELHGDQNVVVHRGHILRLFETIVIVSGRFNGSGYDNRKTNGIGISSEGLFKLLNASIDNPRINYLTNHFVVEYYNSNIFIDSGLDTNLKGIVINYRGIEF